MKQVLKQNNALNIFFTYFCKYLAFFKQRQMYSP